MDWNKTNNHGDDWNNTEKINMAPNKDDTNKSRNDPMRQTSSWINQLLTPAPNPLSKWYAGGLPSKHTAKTQHWHKK